MRSDWNSRHVTTILSKMQSTSEAADDDGAAASIDSRLERIAGMARALTSERMTRKEARGLCAEALELIASCDVAAVQRAVQLEATIANGTASSAPTFFEIQNAGDHHTRSIHNKLERMKSISRMLLSDQMTCTDFRRLAAEGRGLGASCRSGMPGAQRGPVVIEQQMMPR